MAGDKMHMVLNIPSRWIPGKYSGVDMRVCDDVKVVVCVCDVPFGCTLYYCVGVVGASGVIDWISSPESYETGQYPSVSLIQRDKELYAIETHSSDYFNTCYYNIGKVDVKEKRIKWGNSHRIGRGKNPKVSTSNNGAVVVVRERSYSYWDYLELSVGELPAGGREIDWKLEDQTIPHFHGVEPDVAINTSKIVVVCRSIGRIQLKMGNINNNLSIDWLPANLELLAHGRRVDGRSPSISLNSQCAILECHQTWSMRKLSYCYGYISNDRLLWGESEVRDTGEYPCVSLLDDGSVFETHKSHVGNRLFYRQGELVNQFVLH
jgi:hypothetical protein